MALLELWHFVPIILVAFMTLPGVDAADPAPKVTEVTDGEYIFNGTHCYLCPRDKAKPCERIYAKRDGQPSAGGTYGGPAIFKPPYKLPATMAEFEAQATVGECELPNYDLFKYCARAHFYGKEGTLPVNKSSTTYQNLHNETSLVRDVMWVLITGCILCKEPPKDFNVTIKFVQHIPAGAINAEYPSVCYEKNVTRSTVSVENLAKHSGSTPFLTGGILRQRLCPLSKTQPDITEPVSLNYTGTYLEFGHNCKGTSAIKKVFLPSIYPSGPSDDVASASSWNHREFTGFKVNLDNDKDCVSDVAEWKC